MNILEKPEQAFVPVNQPTNFPRFYLIPDTTTAPIQHLASNDPTFHQCSPTRINSPQETLLHKSLRQEKEIFQETCADAWAALKQAGRDTVRFLAKWIILPLTVASALWVPAGNPAALPL
jgi:hypothetical protein